MNLPNSYALITGASQGLGRAFAFEFAKRKTNLLLVALPGENLRSLATQLNDYQIVIHFFETDLALRENVEALAATVNRDFAVQYLVNNAGRGGSTAFEAASVDYLSSILQVNMVALALLTRLLLPNLRQQKSAYILNVSSMAAFTPIGFKTVYPASKAFVRHFSLGLREELWGTGISVSVLYPGPMKTNPEVIQRIENQGFKGKIGLLTPERLAAIALRQMLLGRANIVPGFANKLTRFLMGLLPESMVIKMVSKAVKQEVKKFEDGKSA